MLTIRTMRPSTIRGRGRVATIAGIGVLGRMLRWLPGPSLDRNPVLWREWHRSRSPRVALLLGVLIVMTTVACGFEAFVVWNDGVDWGGASLSVAGGVYSYMLQVIVGLMVLSAVAPLSLSEERQRGSLDILMTTPLSTRTIVVGKWLSTFRLVPWLVIGPGLLAWAMATSPKLMARRGTTYAPGEFLYAGALVVITILAHGSAITSFGLILATWIRRQSRAIGISVTLFVLTAIGWPLLVGQISNRPGGRSYPLGAALSPIYTVEALVGQLTYPNDEFRDLLWEVTAWDLGMVVVAIGLMELTVRTFNRCLGRMAGGNSKAPVISPTGAKARPPGDLGPSGVPDLETIPTDSAGTLSRTIVVDDKFRRRPEGKRRRDR